MISRFFLFLLTILIAPLAERVHPTSLAYLLASEEAQISQASSSLRHEGSSVGFLFQPPLMAQPMVWACVNNSKPLLFIVDTGVAPATLLFPWVAQAANINSSYFDGDKTGQGDEEKVDVRLETLQLVSPESVSNGRVAWNEGILLKPQHNVLLLKKEVEELKRVVLPNGKTVRVAGFIGASCFQDVVVSFDFNRRVLRVQDGETFHAPAKAMAIPLTIESPDYPHETRWLVPVRIGTKSDLLMLDTGSEFTSAREVSEAFPLRKGAPVLTIEGREQRAVYASKRMLIGTTYIRNVVLYQSAPKQPGIIGNNVLSAFKVVLDSSSRMLYLEPVEKAQKACEDGLPIVRVEKRDGSLRVSYMQAKSLADIAGLMLDDKLASIDGFQAATLTLNQANDAVVGIGGTQATLVVERNGRRKKIVYRRPYIFKD